MSDTNESKLVDLPLNDFLDAVAKRQSTPGGGAVAGVAGALATSLARMVAAYSTSKKATNEHNECFKQIADRLQQLDRSLRDSIDRDAKAYGAYVAASRDKSGSAESVEQRRAATLNSMAVPMSIAVHAKGTLDVLCEMVPAGSKWLLSDLEAAAILAEATVRCAGCFVRVNTELLQDPATADDAHKRISTLEQSAQGVLSKIVKARRTRLHKID